MKIEFLRELVALAQCGNFRTTAEKLFVSQPALSNHIKAVEQELGFEIFDRANDNEPTEAGMIFIDGAQLSLSSLDRTIEECRQIISLRQSDATVRIAPWASVRKIYSILENQCIFPYTYVDYDMKKPILSQFSKGDTDILVSSYDLDLLLALHDEAQEMGLSYDFFGTEECAIAIKVTNPLATGELTRERLRGAQVAILSAQNSANWKTTIHNLLGSDLGLKFCFYPVGTPENFRTVDLDDKIYISIAQVVEEYFACREGYVARYTVDGEPLLNRESIIWRHRAENPNIEKVVSLLMQQTHS